MEREIKLLGYLPEILKKIKEFQELTSAEDPEFRSIAETAEIVLNNCFVDTLDTYGCGRWEKMLAITPKDTDDIELRRARIKAALNGDTPYTMRSLENKLNTLCGEGNFNLMYANDEYTLIIELKLERKAIYDYLKEVLEGMIPANIILNIKLLFNTHGTIKKKGLTNAEMRSRTHRALREEVL